MRRVSPQVYAPPDIFQPSVAYDYNYDPEPPFHPQDLDPYSDQYYNPPLDHLPLRSPQYEQHSIPVQRRSYYTGQISRTPSPIPALTSPSPSYLDTSLEPSTTDDPARKLLILDMNGTLVFRSAHTRREYHRPKFPGDVPPPLRPLRTVHARPYLSSFTAYLFHTQTRQWLDTMVWSSAQPHSVADMVDKCFGERKGGLVAVWARDTLGLSDFDYHRKSQTTKDLAKPWAALPLSRSQRRLGVNAPPLSPTNAQKHSAKTTLLLDDSPLKAQLQPWNHLCIREYVSEMRQGDVAVRDAEVVAARNAEVVAARNVEVVAARNAQVTAVRDAELELEPERESGDPENAQGGTEAKKKRKREKKMMKKALAKKAIDELDTSTSTKKYDRTLLAVIGILDTIKSQSNVAGWMRGGGLLRTRDVVSLDSDFESGSGVLGSMSGVLGLESRESSIASSTEFESPPKKRRTSGDEREREPGSEMDAPSSPILPPPSSSQADISSSQTDDSSSQTDISSSQTGVPSSQTGVSSSQTGVPSSQTGVSSSQTDISSSQTDDSSSPPERHPLLPTDVDVDADAQAQASSGIPMVPPTIQNLMAPSTSKNMNGLSSSPSPDEPRSSSLDELKSASPDEPVSSPTNEPVSSPTNEPKLWFENDTTLEYWAAKGEEALCALGIEVVSGVVGSHG